MCRHYFKITLALVLTGLVYASTSVFAELPIEWMYPTEYYGPIVYGSKGEDGSPGIKYCENVVGQRVQVEGIAWVPPLAEDGRTDFMPPGAPRVIFEGGIIYAQGDDFTKAKVHGKLVRIGGTIEAYGELNACIKAHCKQLDQDDMRHSHGMYSLQGYSQRRPMARKYFYIKITSLEIVDKVVEPKIVLQPPKE